MSCGQNVGNHQIVFQIHRVSDKGQMMDQGTFATEAEARDAANKLYRRDKY